MAMTDEAFFGKADYSQIAHDATDTGEIHQEETA